MDEDDSDEGKECNTSGILSPIGPLFLESVVGVDAPPADSLQIWQPSGSVLRWGIFAKEIPPDSDKAISVH